MPVLRFIEPCLPSPTDRPPVWLQLDSRDQARRLPADGAAGPGWHPALARAGAETLAWATRCPTSRAESRRAIPELSKPFLDRREGPERNTDCRLGCHGGPSSNARLTWDWLRRP